MIGLTKPTMQPGSPRGSRVVCLVVVGADEGADSVADEEASASDIASLADADALDGFL